MKLYRKQILNALYQVCGVFLAYRKKKQNKTKITALVDPSAKVAHKYCTQVHDIWTFGPLVLPLPLPSPLLNSPSPLLPPLTPHPPPPAPHLPRPLSFTLFTPHFVREIKKPPKTLKYRGWGVDRLFCLTFRVPGLSVPVINFFPFTY